MSGETHFDALNNALKTIAEAAGEAAVSAAALQMLMRQMGKRYNIEMAELRAEVQKLRQDLAALEAKQPPAHDYMEEWKR